MIRAFVAYCMVLNPTLCRTLEIVPVDGHPITSQMECLIGGAIFDAEQRIEQQTPEGQDGLRIKYEGIEWEVTRVYCRQEGDDNDIVRLWLKKQHEHEAATEPQIK